MPTRFLNRFLTRAFTVLVLATTIFGCGSNDSENDFTDDDEVAQIRLIQGVSDASDVDLLIDGLLVAAGVSLGQGSRYAIVDEGIRRVRGITSDGATAPQVLFDLQSTLEDGERYSAISFGTRANPAGFVVRDNVELPRQGEFKLRFVQIAPSTRGAVDVYLTRQNTPLSDAQPFLRGVTFPFASDYFGFDENELQLRITPVGSREVLADSGPLLYRSGQVRTFVLTDSPGGGEPLRLTLLADRDDDFGDDDDDFFN